MIFFVIHIFCNSFLSVACGGNIIVNETKQVIEFIGKYSKGQKCSWHLKVCINRITNSLSLSLSCSLSFSLSHTHYYCNCSCSCCLYLYHYHGIHEHKFISISLYCAFFYQMKFWYNIYQQINLYMSKSDLYRLLIVFGEADLCVKEEGTLFSYWFVHFRMKTVSSST